MTDTHVKLLLIEDSPTDRELIEHLLADVVSAVFHLSHADTLAAGIERLCAGGCDAALLDLSLPDSRGLETFRSLAAQVPALPIVVLSGLDDQSVAMEAVQQGAQDYLVKGRIDGDLLARSVRYAIERKRAEIALQRANDELERRVDQRTAQLERMQDEARQRQEELAHVARLNVAGGLASGLAHELNQPLMSIVAFVDSCQQRLARDELETDHLREVLSDISAEAIRAGDIIRRLRRLVGKQPAARSRVHLNDVVRDTAKLMERELSTHRVRLRLDLAGDLPAVACDPIQVQQVLLNLIQNAIQAMQDCDADARELAVQSRFDTAASQVDVRVSDSGPGVAREDLHRLFEPFFTTTPDGLGLGLSISRSIAEAHGGRLMADFDPGQQLVFQFSLPTVTIEAPRGPEAGTLQ